MGACQTNKKAKLEAENEKIMKIRNHNPWSKKGNIKVRMSGLGQDLLHADLKPAQPLNSGVEIEAQRGVAHRVSPRSPLTRVMPEVY